MIKSKNCQGYYKVSAFDLEEVFQGQGRCKECKKDDFISSISHVGVEDVSIRYSKQTKQQLR